MRSFSGRHAALQFLEPVLHYVDLSEVFRLFLFFGLEHKKTPIRPDRIVRTHRCSSVDVAGISAMKKRMRLAGAERWARLDVYGHHSFSLIAGSVEEFVALRRPVDFRSSVDGDLTFSAGAGKRLHIYLKAT